MNAPLNIYARVGPAVLILILAEFIYCLWKKNGFYSFQDSVIGLGTAIIAQCVNIAVSVGVIAVYQWIYENHAVWKIEETVTTYLLCYMGVDFLFYWFHRAGHRVNLFWAMHVPHHSAEELNYAVALRSSFTQRAASFLFYWPLALLGFSPQLILPVVALNLVIQLIPHTRVIPKLPAWIDSWLNTPYHHQVHHAANPIYWDKNYGGTFIFWDKWFGTYQDQTEPLYYGVTVHPRSWDPTYLNFHWFLVLWRDTLDAPYIWDKFKLWFMPPGWRPRGLPEKREGSRIWEHAHLQEKYQTQALIGSTLYLSAQLIPAFWMMFLVIGNQSPLTTLEKFVLSLALWLLVTSWGAILESRIHAKSLALFANTTTLCALIWSYKEELLALNQFSWSLTLGLVFCLWAAFALKKMDPIRKNTNSRFISTLTPNQ